MAFSDNPTSDKYSKNSEKSLHALKGILLMDNGFISRTVTPDYGVDEKIELLLQNGNEFSGASNKHFALQLKSVDTKNPYIKKKGKDYIKLQFETSRLGYLLKIPPAYGIISIYDVKTEVIYYEYAEEIYNHLTDIHQGKSWKSKKSVTIYISKGNILNNNSAREIHSNMLQRHTNAQLCFNAFGADYGINTYEDEITKDKLDFNNPKVVIEQLNLNGWKLIHANEFSMILSLLEKVHNNDIFKSNKLTAIVATTYCESGKFIDSNYIISKYNQIYDDSDEYYDSLEFIKFKTDFALGKLDYKGYQTTLERIVNNIKGEYNQIIIKINLLHIKLLTETNNKKYNEETIKDIMSIVQIISNSKLEEKSKFYLSTYNIFNIIIYYINYITSTIGAIKLKESLNQPIFQSEILEFIKKETLFDELIRRTLAKTWIFADKNDDTYLKASCLQNTSNYFFLKNLNALMMDSYDLLSLESSMELFETKINQAFSAANLFEELGRYKDSYSSLNLAYELTALYFHTQGEEINNKLSDLDLLLQKFAKQYGFSKYESQVIDYFNKKKEGYTVNDELIEEYAYVIIDSLKIPTDRKMNIVLSMENNNLFAKLENSINFNLLEDLKHTLSSATHYKEPVTYILECKKCKQHSLPNQDINVIVSYMNMHNCKE